jgi:hypothetical protein
MNNNNIGEGMNELELKDAFIKSLADRMAKADWYYEYSDDHRVWQSGVAAVRQIKEDLKLLATLDGGLDAAQQLWLQHVPPHSVNSPDFFAEPKKVNAFMNGMFFREDLPDLVEKLSEQKNAGNNFVAFSDDPLVPPSSRFTGFSSSLQAMTFAESKSTLDEDFKVYSISRMQRELQAVIEPDTNKSLRDIANRLEHSSNEQKSSRGYDLSI